MMRLPASGFPCGLFGCRRSAQQVHQPNTAKPRVDISEKSASCEFRESVHVELLLLQQRTREDVKDEVAKSILVGTRGVENVSDI